MTETSVIHPKNGIGGIGGIYVKPMDYQMFIIFIRFLKKKI